MAAVLRPALLASGLLTVIAFAPGGPMGSPHVRVPPVASGVPRGQAPGLAMTASPSDSGGRGEEFRKLAARNGLARFLEVRKTLDGVNLMVPYRMMRDVETYAQWMPLCTGGVPTERGPDGETTRCKVAFGLETGTPLGTLGDNVSYSMTLVPPRQVSRRQAEARVVSDTGSAGFAYGERLVYDWAFTMTETFPGRYKTLVSLDIFIQVKAPPYAMIWDAVQQPLTGRMLRAIEERARSLAGVVPDFELQTVPPRLRKE